MASTYRAAIIGCGGYARVHAQGYRRIEGVELVAGADLDEQRARRFGEEERVAWYTDWERMATEQRPDLISITTHHAAHAPLTIACAQSIPSLRAITVEKPMAMSLGEADDMMATCDRGGVVLAVGHQRRFNIEWIEGKKLWEKGAIGDPLLVVGRWPSGNTGMYRYEVFGGGALPFLGSHTLDLMRFFFGDAAWVLAQVDLADPPVDVERRTYAHLAFEGGVHGVLETGEGMDASYYRGQTVTVYGTQGAVEMIDAVGTRWRCGDHPEWIALELDMEKVEGHKSNLWGTHALLADVVACVHGSGEPVCGARNGRAALELCMAIYQSERLGCRVELPLRERESPLRLMLAERPRRAI